MTRKTALIVEDKEDNLKLLRDILEYNNYDVACALDGTEAFEILEKPELPDVILLDIQLAEEGPSGYDVAKVLKESERTKNVPIIAVTAFAMHDDREKILAAGFNGYVSKPYLMHQILEEIQKNLEQ